MSASTCAYKNCPKTGTLDARIEVKTVFPAEKIQKKVQCCAFITLCFMSIKEHTAIYSRTLMAQTLMARLPWLFRTRS